MQKTVAIVNDDPSVLGFIQELLSEEGYATETAVAGAGAFDLIASTRPAAVVLDIRMETPDAGLRVLEQLRGTVETASIPVLVCTADKRFLHERGITLEGLRCDILEKPFDIAEMLERVAALTGGRTFNDPATPSQ